MYPHIILKNCYLYIIGMGTSIQLPYIKRPSSISCFLINSRPLCLLAQLNVFLWLKQSTPFLFSSQLISYCYRLNFLPPSSFFKYLWIPTLFAYIKNKATHTLSLGIRIWYSIFMGPWAYAITGNEITDKLANSTASIRIPTCSKSPWTDFITSLKIIVNSYSQFAIWYWSISPSIHPVPGTMEQTIQGISSSYQLRFGHTFLLIPSNST